MKFVWFDRLQSRETVDLNKLIKNEALQKLCKAMEKQCCQTLPTVCFPQFSGDPKDILRRSWCHYQDTYESHQILRKKKICQISPSKVTHNLNNKSRSSPSLLWMRFICETLFLCRFRLSVPGVACLMKSVPFIVKWH